ncbi:MAG: hypothetical protein B7Y39_13240 [Bdellovibrio sp. 28-41-41]|nr:MAG: hypothetical protein B7Y39_13240 [Bdellovibrio sp. 28-41-41]
MNARNFAFWGGVVMLAMGILSLIPGLVGTKDTLPPLFVETSYGLFMNLFPMNIFNKVALILFGAAGIWTARSSSQSLERSAVFSQVVFYVMGGLAILGLFPATNTLFGYWPLFGGEVFGHALFAVIGAYCAFYKAVTLPNTTGLAERYP